MRVTFDVTLVANNNLTCLSNIDILSKETEGGDKKLVKFNKIPPMSTYVWQFKSVLSSLVSSGQFALEVAAKTVRFYEESFDSPFPLPKMDLLA